jgi:hypothetical protein
MVFRRTTLYLQSAAKICEQPSLIAKGGADHNGTASLLVDHPQYGEN